MNKIKNVEINDVDVELDKKVNYKFKDHMTFVSKEFGITRNVPLESIFKENKFGNNISENNIILHYFYHFLKFLQFFLQLNFWLNVHIFLY